MSLVVAVADYAASLAVRSGPALEAARHCLIDALARSFEALRDPECASLIGPLVPGAVMPGGARVPGTSLELDPAQAAFCLSVMLCRSPGGESSLGLSCDHGGASLAAVLATADYRARKAMMEGKPPPAVRDALAAIAKTLEIQGVLALESGKERAWAANIHSARIAATAMAAAQLGGTRGQILDALSYACPDGMMWLDTDLPDDRMRKAWITADAISQAVRHACQAIADSRSSHPMPVRSSTFGRPFGTAVLDRLAERLSSQEHSRLAMRFQAAVDRHFPARQAERIKALFAEPERLDELPVNELLAALVTNGAR